DAAHVAHVDVSLPMAADDDDLVDEDLTGEEVHTADIAVDAGPDPVTPEPGASVAAVARAPELTLTSKRLGELDSDRETSDLLTADRLLDPNHLVRPEPEGVFRSFL